MVDFESADMEEFIAECVQAFCPVCGKALRQKENGRPRKFCSDKCRNKFWKAHPKPEQWGSYREKECPVCGRLFYAQREKTRTRKYCSRACANRGRAMKEGTDV